MTFPETRPELYDPIRKQWVARTPEEEVRQALLQYLLQSLKTPPSLIGVEVSLSRFQIGNLKKADLVVWRKTEQPSVEPLSPWLLVECKAPGVALKDDVMWQVQRYMKCFPSRYIMITNGGESLYYELRDKNYHPISGLPPYSDK